MSVFCAQGIAGRVAHGLREEAAVHVEYSFVAFILITNLGGSKIGPEILTDFLDCKDGISLHSKHRRWLSKVRCSVRKRAAKAGNLK